MLWILAVLSVVGIARQSLYGRIEALRHPIFFLAVDKAESCCPRFASAVKVLKKTVDVDRLHFEYSGRKRLLMRVPFPRLFGQPVGRLPFAL